MAGTVDEAVRVLEESDLLHDESAVEAALDRMAAMLNDLLDGTDPIVLCVLTGGIVTAGRLLPRLRFPLRLDYCHATRYRGETSGRELQWFAEPHYSLAGETVLVVDDILDEGHTLAAILDYCRNEGAKAVHCAVLVEKRHDRRNPQAHAEVVGLTVEDRYVFGVGMDYHEYLRNAPGIRAVKGQ